MNPYGITKHEPFTYAQRAELARWNEGVERAREEYHAHPFVTCLGTRRVDGEAVPCWNLRHYGILCRHCEKERRRVVARMLRIRRAS